MNRRDFLKSVLTVAALAPTVKLDAGSDGEKVLSGRVIAAESGKGLPGIRVTNGSEVVLTDANGGYELPRHPGLKTRFVSVVVPGDRVCDKRYRPVAERGGDFALAPRKISRGFTFIHVSDTETMSYERHLNEIMAYARNTGAAFIVHTGDLSGKPNKKKMKLDPDNPIWQSGIAFQAAKMNTEIAGRPVYYTIGNHDMRGKYGESVWESYFGPVVYAFEEGDALFVALPISKGDVRPFDKPDDTARFLKNLLATYPADTKVFLLAHTYAPLDFDGVFLRGSRYEVDLKKWDFCGAIHGHSHRSSVTPCGKKALVWSTGMSSGGGYGNTPASFREFTVTADGKVTSELRYLYQTRQLHGIVSPAPDANGEYPVAVVAYDTVMPVMKVAAERGDERIELKKQSPMLWCGSFKTPGDAPLRTVATFADGSEFKAENASLSGKRLKLRRMIPLPCETRLGAPVTDGERIFVSTIDDHNGAAGGLAAFDAATGKLLWRCDCGSGVRNSPAVDAGEVAIAADGGKVALLDAATGKEKWSIAPKTPSYPYRAPRIAGDTVYAQLEKAPSALSRADGAVKWQNASAGDRFGSSSPFLLSEGRLIVAVNWGFVYSIDAGTGKTVWQSERQEGRVFFMLQPTTALLPDGDVLTVESRSAVVLDAKTGKIKRSADQKARGATAGAPVVDGDLILKGTPGLGLTALDTAKLKLRWHTGKTMGRSQLATVQYNAGGVNTVEAAPLPLGKEIFCSHTCGKLYRLARESGKVLGELNIGAPLLSSPAMLGKDRLVLNDFAGRLLIFDIVK